MATRGLILLAKDTFTSASSVSFDNVFSNTYKQYKIISNFTNTVNTYANIRMRASGTDNASSNYNRQSLYISSTTVSPARATYTSFLGVFSPYTESISQIEIINPYQTAYTSLVASKIDDSSNSSIASVYSAQGMTVNTSYDGFSVIPNSGIMSGTITVYGLAQ